VKKKRRERKQVREGEGERVRDGGRKM